MTINVFTRHEWRGVPIELGNMWTLEKDGRILLCRLTSHPVGWELRVELDGELHRSQACKVDDEVLDTADDWRRQAEAKGWQPA